MTETTTVEAPTTVEVGDFFYASWGYDQTNVNFFKVVGKTASGKSIKVQEWASAVESDNGPQIYVVPGSGPKVGCSVYDPEKGYSTYDPTAVSPVETKRLKSRGPGHFAFHWRDYSDAYLWDGKAKYETGSGYGH